MAPRTIRPDQLAEILPAGGLTWLQGCSAESQRIREALVAAGDGLGDMIFTGIFVPGLNRIDYAVSGSRRARTFFMTPELARAGDRVEFLPLNYRDILAHLGSVRIDAALFMVSPPDGNGMCSFGPVVDYLADLWPAIPLKIAHINPAMAATHGHVGIPYSDLTAVLEGEEKLPMSAAGSDETSVRIGRHVAGIIADGSIVQAGLGRVPEAAVAALGNHRNLSIHSGLIGDSALDLLEAGALKPGPAIVAGVAIGTQRLYDAIGSEAFAFRPVSHTHSLAVLAGLKDFVAINSAFEVDLFGQAYAEMTSKGFLSGPGGASDFAVGGRANGGLRIVALPSCAGATSRIVGPGEASGMVSLGRFDIDIVVTEHGLADLRGKSHERRAEALLDVAAPQHRDRLADAWTNWRKHRSTNR